MREASLGLLFVVGRAYVPGARASKRGGPGRCCEHRAAAPSEDWVINLEELAAGELRLVTSMFDMPDLDASWRDVPGIRFRRESS